MKPSLPDSPVKPALLSVLCSLIPCVIFFVPWRGLRHSHLYGTYLLVSFVIFGGFAILSLKFVSDFRQGVENERWPEAQIERLRAHLESHYYTVLSIVLLLAFLVFEFPLKPRFGGLGWGCFLLGQTISQLRIAVRRPRPSTPSIDWRNSGPLHSDHWGQR